MKDGIALGSIDLDGLEEIQSEGAINGMIDGVELGLFEG